MPKWRVDRPARRRALARSLLFVAWLVMGCGGGSAAAPSSRQLTGEAALVDDDAPRFAIEGIELPEPPASVDADDPALEPLVARARELLGRALPQAERDMPAAEVGGYVEGRLSVWMNATAHGIRALWDAMQGLETRVLGAHVVARAITGATLATLAERMERLPLPTSVEGDSSLASGIRDALSNASRPMRDRAVQALGACASAAVGSADPTLDEWRTYCDAESERVQGLAAQK